MPVSQSMRLASEDIKNPSRIYFSIGRCGFMPKGKDEWVSGKESTSLEMQILSFLSQNSEKGFNFEEVLEGTGWTALAERENLDYISKSDAREDYELALHHLREQGKIELRTFPPSVSGSRGHRYYKFVRKEDRL